jgi:hypothetical protein
VRGRPPCSRRRTLIRSITGAYPRLSWRYPALVMGQRPAPGVRTRGDLSGRPDQGPAECLPLLGLRTRFRRAVSRLVGGFLMIRFNPGVPRRAQHGWGQPVGADVLGRLVAGPGGVLVGVRHRGIVGHCPVLALGDVAAGLQRRQDLLPRPNPRPAMMPVVDGLPAPVHRRWIPPRLPGAHPVEHPIDHSPVIGPPVPLTRRRRKQRRQPGPLVIAQAMPLQPLLLHNAQSKRFHDQDLRDTPWPRLHGRLG